MRKVLILRVANVLATRSRIRLRVTVVRLRMFEFGYV